MSRRFKIAEELVKLGHEDPAAYLASYGFRREVSS